MVRKIFLILIPFFFLACASKPAPAPAEKSEPVPDVSINVNGTAVVVGCSYLGDDWLFIKGVEFRNASGETRRVMFKNPRRRVVSAGLVSEFATFSVAYGDEFLAWCGENVEARALADWPQDFGYVKLHYAER